MAIMGMKNWVMSQVDDVTRLGIRGIFQKHGNYMPFDNANRGAFFKELHAGNPLARETMNKFHYGSFMGTSLQGAVEKELLTKGAGWSGAVFGRPMKGLGVGISHAKGLPGFMLAFGAFEAATAPRGHRASGFIKGAMSTGAYAVGDIIGSTLLGPLGGMIVGSAFGEVGSKVGDAFQAFADFNQKVRHVNMGGNYEDTRLAFTMRQRAAQEMGSSVMNARQYLGKEAILMHQ